LTGPSCRRALGPLPGYAFAGKLTIQGRHVRHQAPPSPQNNLFELLIHITFSACPGLILQATEEQMRGQEIAVRGCQEIWDLTAAQCPEGKGCTDIPGVEERVGHDAYTRSEPPPGPAGLAN